MDREAWRAVVHEVAKSRTRLSDWTELKGTKLGSEVENTKRGSDSERMPCRAKLLQSCPTLRDPMDGSPPGSSVHRILQARILEWVAIWAANIKANLRKPSGEWVCVQVWVWVPVRVGTYVRMCVRAQILVCVCVCDWGKNLGTAGVKWVQRCQLVQGLVQCGKFTVLNVCAKASVRGYFIYTFLDLGDYRPLCSWQIEDTGARELEWFLQSRAVS